MQSAAHVAAKRSFPKIKIGDFPDAPNAQGPGSIPGQETRCRTHAATKSLHAAIKKKKRSWDFPGGAAVKNPSASAGNTGSSPGPGRSHMLQSS